MSATKARIATLQVLISGSVIAQDSHVRNMVVGELGDVFRAAKIPERRRRHLLQVLHATRALDSTLKQLMACYGLTADPPALGPYLKSLVNHQQAGIGNLGENERKRYQASIVDKRNRLMHEAGAYPATEQEVLELIAEMQSCLSRVLNL